MKSIKMMAFSLLFVLFTIHFPQAQAANTKGSLPVYEEVISDISLGYNKAMLTGHIKLANGALLHLIDYKTRDDNAMNEWHAGDALVFSPYSHKEKLILAVKRVANGRLDERVEPYVIFDIAHLPKTMLTITEMREKGKFIKLSDHSVWEFSFYNTFSTEEWKVGDRVLVSGHGDKNSYNFINMDVPLKHNVYSATASFVID
ncbi:MAG: hypothetical protein H0V82_10315 [Candidatus Protochlamydia sp.]|nr:hypothetical protein [Candidatus Protochlamydia sp.]